MGKRKREDEGDRNLLLDDSLGADILNKSTQNSWWDWSNRSRLVFWRWPKSFISQTKTGCKVFILAYLPTNIKRARKPKPDLYPLYVEKFKDIIDKVYAQVNSKPTS